MSKASDNYERVVASEPVDALARRVTSKGEERTKAKGISNDVVVSDVQMAGQPFIGRKEDDFRGRRFGFFTVVSYLGKTAPNKYSRWCVRCDCGLYEVRTTKTLKKQFGILSKMCRECVHVELLKMGCRPTDRAEKIKQRGMEDED